MKISRLALTSALALPLIASCSLHYRNGYSFDYSGVTAESKDQGSVAAGIDCVRVDHTFGDVVIVATALGEAPAWRWELTTWGDDTALAEAYRDEVELQSTLEGSTLSWRLVLPDSPGSDLNGIKSKLWLSLDPMTAVEFTNSHGDTTVTNMQASVRSNNSHGDSHYAGLGEGYQLAHQHGNVVLDNMPSGRVKIAHGHLTASNIEGQLELRAQHSKLELTELHDGLRLDAQHTTTVIGGFSGSLIFDGAHSALTLKGDPRGLDLTSSFGDLEIHCQGGHLVTVTADTQHCDLTLTLPPNTRVSLMANARHGRVTSTLPSGSGGEGIPVAIEASFGDVLLRSAD